LLGSLSSSGVEMFLERNSTVPFCLLILFAHFIPTNKPVKTVNAQAILPIRPGIAKNKIKPRIKLTKRGDATICSQPMLTVKSFKM